MELELTPEQFGYLMAVSPIVAFCVAMAIAFAVWQWAEWTQR